MPNSPRLAEAYVVQGGTPKTAIMRRGLLAATTLPILAQAQSLAQNAWRPDRPVRLIVGFAPGCSADLVGRLVAPELAKKLGQPVTVENRSGASGNLATQAVVAAPADGLTIGFAGLQLATNPAMIAQLGYDPAGLQMIGQLVALPVLVFSSSRSGIRSIPELAARARALPEGWLTASGGYGTSGHLGPEIVFGAMGARYTHVVFRGGAPAFQAIAAGEADVGFDIVAGYHAPTAAEGRINLLAVLQDVREPALPNVPAIAEHGFGPAAQMRSWQGLYVRAGTPPAAVMALHAATNAAVASLSERFRALGMTPTPSASPEAFQALYVAEAARWSGMIRAAGIVAQ